MLQLKNYYGIVGGEHDYPNRGVAPGDGVPWYQLALAIASEFDDSLKIVDAKPRGKTAPRWRGPEGRMLLTLVDAIRESRPGRPVRWCLEQLRKREPAYGPLEQLEVRYYEAQAHFGTTKQPRK